jgi:hypothetical protein
MPFSSRDITDDEWFTGCLELTHITKDMLAMCRFSIDGFIYIIDVLKVAGVSSPVRVWNVLQHSVPMATLYTYSFGHCCSFRDLIYIFIGCTLPQFNNLRGMMVKMSMNAGKIDEPSKTNARLVKVVRTLKKYGNKHLKKIRSLEVMLRKRDQEIINLTYERE